MSEHPVSLPAFYIITLKSGHFYIGSTKNLYRRLLRHKFTLENGVHPNRHLQSAFTTWEDFNIQFTHCKDRHSAMGKEQQLLDERVGDPLCLNISKTAKPDPVANGASAAAHAYWTDEKKSRESRQKISVALKGKPLSDETRAKMSLAKLNRSRAVICDGIRFSSLVDAATHYGIPAPVVNQRITGKVKGYSKWKYLDAEQ